METMTINEAIENSLFFFGAGSSKDAGCKLSQDMLIDLNSRICDNSEDLFLSSEKEALKFLLSCLDYHAKWRSIQDNNREIIQPNVEELALLIRRIKNRENFLPYPITGNWADKLVMLENQFKNESEKSTPENLFERLERNLREKLLRVWLEIPNETDYLNPINELLESNPHANFRLSIFTLNNDEVLEKHLAKTHTHPFRGFTSGEWVGFKSIPEDFSQIDLYKLHGSLDWIRMNDGAIYDESKLKKDEELKDQIDIYPFLIFGHGTKFFSIEPFFSLIQEFREKLRNKKFFFTIGYSLFDPYINNLFIEELKRSNNENEGKKLIIVNPDFAVDALTDDDFVSHPKEGCKMINNTPSSEKKLSGYIKWIQQNQFYSEIPEFNVFEIPGDSLDYFKMGASDFFEFYFKNKGSEFVNLANKYKDKAEKSLPFGAHKDL